MIYLDGRPLSSCWLFRRSRITGLELLRFQAGRINSGCHGWLNVSKSLLTVHPWNEPILRVVCFRLPVLLSDYILGTSLGCRFRPCCF